MLSETQLVDAFQSHMFSHEWPVRLKLRKLAALLLLLEQGASQQKDLAEMLELKPPQLAKIKGPLFPAACSTAFLFS